MKEIFVEAWCKSNLRTRIGMVACGLGIGALGMAVACETVSSVEVNGHHADLGQAELDLAIGGAITLLGGQQLFIRGYNQMRTAEVDDNNG